jgi:hypothetical protein
LARKASSDDLASTKSAITAIEVLAADKFAFGRPGNLNWRQTSRGQQPSGAQAVA